MQQVDVQLDNVNQQLKKLEEVQRFLKEIQTPDISIEKKPSGDLKIFKYWQ